MRTVLPMVVALLATAPACKKRSLEVDTGCPGEEELSREDLLREQKRIANGENVGAQLADPKIEVDTRGVSINGRVVKAMVGLDGSKLERIDVELTCLKNMREHWKQIHPGDAFPGNAEVIASGDVQAPLAESVITTAAFAGFPNAHVSSAGSTWRARIWVPAPPRPDVPAPPPAFVTMTGGASGYRLSVIKHGPRCAPTPAGGAESLPSVVADACEGVTDCALFVDPAPDTFAHLSSLVAPAFVSAPALSIAFRPPDDPVAACPPAVDPNAATAPWGREDSLGAPSR